MSEGRWTRRNPPDLAAIASQIVRKLGGVWHGDHGMCRCPAHDDRRPSLSVRLGNFALLFKCFAGCDQQEVLQAIRHIDARALLRPDPSARLHKRDNIADRCLIQRAWAVWMNAQPLSGTRASAYLRRRGLRTSSAALRYCHATPLGRGRSVRFRPALLAAVCEGGTFRAVQRTFLEIGKPARARDLGNHRRMLGRPMGGAVMLAPAGQALGLAEGIETALSAIALLGIPVWATLGSERMNRIAIPAGVEHLILLPDRDRAGERGAAKAILAYEHSGRRVEIIWPPPGCKDWNDALRMGGKREGMGGDRRIEWSARRRQETLDHA